jgi:hypothetical protein
MSAAANLAALVSCTVLLVEPSTSSYKLLNMILPSSRASEL